MTDAAKGKRGRGRQRQYSQGRRLTQFRLDPETRALLDAYCEEKGQTLQVCLDRLVSKFLENPEAFFAEKKKSH